MILIYEFMRHFLSFSWFLLNCVIKQIAMESHVMKKNIHHLVIGMEAQSRRRPLIVEVWRACCEFLGFRDRPRDKPLDVKKAGEGGQEGVCESVCVYSHSLSRVRLCDPMDCGPPGSSVHVLFLKVLLVGLVLAWQLETWLWGGFHHS